MPTVTAERANDWDDISAKRASATAGDKLVPGADGATNNESARDVPGHEDKSTMSKMLDPVVKPAKKVLGSGEDDPSKGEDIMEKLKEGGNPAD